MTSRAGFTLVELTIVVALMATIAILGIPFGVETYRDYALISTTRDMVSVLRRASSLALANTDSSPYGASFRVDRAVLFKGGSYITREAAFDEEHFVSPSVTVSAPSDVVFAPLSGNAESVLTVTVTNGFRSQGIDINLHGVVAW